MSLVICNKVISTLTGPTRLQLSMSFFPNSNGFISEIQTTKERQLRCTSDTLCLLTWNHNAIANRMNFNESVTSK